jgi:hypothetical protein
MDSQPVFPRRKTVPKFVIAGLMGLTLFAGITALQFPRFRAAQDAAINLSSEQLQQQSEALALQLQLTQNVPAFGFNNLIANWQFLSFLQYFGDAETRARTDYQVSPEFFKVIIPRDPYFFIPYVFLSTSTSIYAAQPQTTVDLMEQGLAYLNPTLPPEAPVIWRFKAVDELLFLGKPDDAIQSYQTAAEWADQSPYPDIQATGDLSRQTAAFIAENPDSNRTLVAGWSQILGQAVDQTTFNLAVEQIEALGGEVIRQPDGQLTIRMPTPPTQ